MMVLTSPGLCLCLTALGEGSKVLVLLWALGFPGKLLNSCWLLSMEQKGRSPYTLSSFFSCVEKFWLLYGQVPGCV